MSAVTHAPEITASCTANCPTPPIAPVTRTRRPSTGPSTRRARSAVRPAIGSEAPCAKETTSGRWAAQFVGTGTRSLQPAPSTTPATRSPSAGPLPSVAARRTTPATSCPGRHPSGRCCSRKSSPRLIPKARTSSKSSCGPGSGSGSSSASLSPPGALGSVI